MIRRFARRDAAGFTLVEVLVAMGLFGVLGTILLGTALASNTVTKETRAHTDVAEETRTAMERLVREMRQSSGLEGVHLSSGATDATWMTFWTDFNGDKAHTSNAADPEVLTYRWDPATGRLSLTAQTSISVETRPLLAAKVKTFDLLLRSSSWEYDANGDGSTTWEELDASPVGNHNNLPDDPELAYVDLVELTLVVDDGDATQTYRTQVDLRNRS